MAYMRAGKEKCPGRTATVQHKDRLRRSPSAVDRRPDQAGRIRPVPGSYSAVFATAARDLAIPNLMPIRNPRPLALGRIILLTGLGLLAACQSVSRTSSGVSMAAGAGVVGTGSTAAIAAADSAARQFD